MIHDYDYDYRGDPELADWIAEVGAKNNVRVNACHYKTLPIHYPSLTTMRYLNPQGTARVLSVSVCQTAEMHNDLAFGAPIGEAVATLPGERRVVFLAAGGDVAQVQSVRRDPAQGRRQPRQHHDARTASGTSASSTCWLQGRHAEVLALSARVQACAHHPEGRWAHYLNMAGALGGRVLHRARHAVRDLRGRARDRPG